MFLKELITNARKFNFASYKVQNLMSLVLERMSTNSGQKTFSRLLVWDD